MQWRGKLQLSNNYRLSERTRFKDINKAGEKIWLLKWKKDSLTWQEVTILPDFEVGDKEDPMESKEKPRRIFRKGIR